MAYDAEDVEPTPLGPVPSALCSEAQSQAPGGRGQSHQALELPSTAVSEEEAAAGPDVSSGKEARGGVEPCVQLLQAADERAGDRV